MHLKNRPRVGFFMPEFCRIQDLCSIVIIIRPSHLGKLSSGGIIQRLACSLKIKTILKIRI